MVLFEASISVQVFLGTGLEASWCITAVVVTEEALDAFVARRPSCMLT